MKFARQLQAFPAPGCDANHESLALQIARHHLAYGLVVIDNQDERAFDRLHRPALRTHPAQERRRLDRLDAGGQADRECRALAQLALYGNLTAHHLAETAADRKSEPGATILARGRRIGLHEFLEQPAHLFARRRLRAALGPELPPRRIAAALAHEPRHVDGHNAMLGELVGVAHQIEQRLADSRLVGVHLADILRTVEDDLVAVLGRRGGDGGDHIVDQRRDGEGLDVHVHPAGFDLRQVQDVVDELQQVVRRAQHALERFELLGVLQVAGILMQHLRQADDRIQGRAQLV